MTLWWRVVVRRYPVGILVGTLAATLVLAGGLGRLEFKSSEDTMIPSGSTVYTDNVRYQHQFGSDPMVIVFTGDPGAAHRARPPAAPRTAAPTRDGRCVPRGARPAHGAPLRRRPTDRGARAGGRSAAHATKRGPTSAAERDELAAAFRQRTAADATRLATVGTHSLDNPAFVDFLVHDATGAVRPSLRGVFPDVVTR